MLEQYNWADLIVAKTAGVTVEKAPKAWMVAFTKGYNKTVIKRSGNMKSDGDLVAAGCYTYF